MVPTFSKDFIIAVGDIHGCAIALERLLNVLLKLPNKVVFLGDYVDRGLSSPGVIGLLIFAKLTRPDWIFLVGNHELMLSQDIELNLSPMGDDSAYEQYLDQGGIPPTHKDFLGSLEVFWESERFLFVHGGIEEDVAKDVKDHSIDELVWTYKIHKDWAGKRIVRGHFAVTEPEQHSSHINLDTGCVFNGWLTAGLLDDNLGELVGSIQVDMNGENIRYNV